MDSFAKARIAYRVLTNRQDSLRNYITGRYMGEFTDAQLTAKLDSLFEEERRSLTEEDLEAIERERKLEGSTQ